MTETAIEEVGIVMTEGLAVSAVGDTKGVAAGEMVKTGRIGGRRSYRAWEGDDQTAHLQRRLIWICLCFVGIQPITVHVVWSLMTSDHWILFLQSTLFDESTPRFVRRKK